MKRISLILALLFSSHLMAKELVRFKIHVEEESVDMPVAVPLSSFDYNTDRGMPALYELTPNGEKQLPCQLETGHTATLWFILKGISEKNSTRTFVLKLNEKSDNETSKLTLEKQLQELKIKSGEKPVLSYHFGTINPPEGVDPLYKRSGFIHPLWSPGGEILSRIQPPDHYHHYGIWGPWTLTHINEREVDFWNLAKGQGTVRFTAFLSETEGEVFSGFKALQQHIDFGAAGEDQIALNEVRS